MEHKAYTIPWIKYFNTLQIQSYLFDHQKTPEIDIIIIIATIYAWGYWSSEDVRPSATGI